MIPPALYLCHHWTLVDHPRVRRTGLVVLCLALSACSGPKVKEPVTIVLLDIGPWGNREYAEWGQRAREGFTRETGIVVKRLTAPESADDQLAFQRRFLESRATTPDVYMIDAIWPGMLAEHFLDLRNPLAQEASEHFPALVANNTVGGRLVAMPFHANVGILFFRTDLLQRHGYAAPPRTWDELQAMAATIQKGERARGNADFWGFVWQGAAYEGLTCNALEWQVTEGGGRIVEDDGTISVDNPRAAQAWQRAAGWVGTISPPGVIAYRESDAEGLWRDGKAAFMRSWPNFSIAGTSGASAVEGRFSITLLPGGPGGRAATLGENSLAVSRYSAHPEEALALVRYLTRRDVQLERFRTTSETPTLPSLYQDPTVLKANPYYAPLKEVFLGGAISRPSSVTGARYADVSAAYARAVHSVLTGKRLAREATPELARELARLTGFPVRDTPPASPAP
jgi:trehalose/maltose transport system substrate-binding protein